MEKLGLLLNFAGAIVIWIDSFVLSSYIAPNKITLSGSSGCKMVISKVFLHIGLLLIVAGFLLQLLARDGDYVVSDNPNSSERCRRNQ